MADKLDGSAIVNYSIPANRLANSSITSTQIQPSLYTTILNATHPKIRSLTYPGDDTAANTGGSQTVIVNGSGFGPNVAIYINGNAVPSVTVTNANSVSFTTAAQAAATYPLYLINTDDGATAILIPGIQYSGTPAWVTTSPLSDQTATGVWNITLSATGDSPIVYSLAAGSSLPSGITLAANGLISGTMTSPPANDTTYNFTVVAIDPQNQDASKAFSVTVTVTVDTSFNYNILLLHGDGTANGNNHAFVDSSTNAFTITRNGNASQGSFSPFSPTGWSNYFSGTSDYLSINSATALNLSTGDFTIECWVFPLNGISNLDALISKRSQGAFSGGDWRIAYITTSNAFGIACGTNNVDRLTPPIVLNQWNHIAFVRSSGTLSCYANGVRGDSLTWTDNLDNVYNLFIGLNVATYDIPAYISNVRILKGTGLYSGVTYTVPTSPLTAITNTSLLTCQSNRFIDNSTNNFGISIGAGTPSVQAFSPFPTTTAYSPSTHGGSAYFDGTGDYLLGPTNNSNLSFGTGDFTIEAWAYPINFSNPNSTIIGAYGASTGAYMVWLPSSGYPNFYVYNSGGLNGSIFTSGTILKSNAWNHVAVTRASGVFRLFLNGALIDSVSNAIAVVNAATSANLSVGAYFQAGMSLETTSPFNGYIADARVIKGTALYTAAFTPPTSPLTAIANTSLLLSCKNAQIYDSTAGTVLETVGDTKVNTSIYKYGTGSIYFDGTGDYLAAAYSPNMSFGTGDFTIEGWFYLNSLANSYYWLAGPWSSATSDEWGIQVQNNGSLRFLTTADTAFYATGIITTNTWYHFAASRSSGTIKAYINGTAFATITNANSIGSVSKTMYIGAQTGSIWYWNGYVDDFRITKGLGRYRYNFTPPTKAFADKGGTETLTSDAYFPYTTLLLPGNGTNNANNQAFVDSSNNNFTITRNGNATQGTFSPFSQTGWGNYFGGTGNYFTTANSAVNSFGASDWTIEFWVNSTQTTRADIFGWNYAYTSAGWGGFIFNLGTSGNIAWYENSTSTISASGTGWNNGAWNHIAVTRSGTSVRLFVNGTQVGSTYTTSFSYGANPSGFIIGTMFDGTTGPFTGYLSNLRVVKGTAVYTANFTPPTAPLTAITNTSLLTCQSNRFIDNSTNAFALTITGSPSIQAFSPFSPSANNSAATNGGSMYFDGDADSLTLTSTANLQLTGAFTIEFWMYLNTIVLDTQHPSIVTFPTSWQIYVNSSSNYIALYNGAADVLASAASSIKTSQWYHVAISRNASNNISLYVNGTRVATTTDSSSIGSTSGTMRLMSFTGTGGDVNGYLSDLRIIKGNAIYDPTVSTLTVPTSPLSAVSNTQLLLSATNAGITDATGKNVLETVGDAKISTTQSKFGGSSMYFDGTGDYLVAPPNDNTDFGAGDFTVEAWVYPASLAAGQDFVGKHADSPGAATQVGWYIYVGANNSGNEAGVTSSSTYYTVTGWSLTANQWQHVAFTRYNGSLRLFINGIQVGSTVSANVTVNSNAAWKTWIGTYTAALRNWNGYIDDLRITKGIARYTSNFTPPTTAFLTK